jgi:hypothetical protein
MAFLCLILLACALFYIVRISGRTVWNVRKINEYGSGNGSEEVYHHTLGLQRDTFY